MICPRQNKARSAAGRAAGFTFLEMAIALGIVVVVFIAAIPVVATALDERVLRGAAEPFQEMVRDARVAAIRSGVGRALVLDEAGIASEGADDVLVAGLPPGCKLRVRYPGGKWFSPDNILWRISAAGMVEPLTLRFDRGNAWLELDFDFLTGRIAEERYSF